MFLRHSDLATGEQEGIEIAKNWEALQTGHKARRGTICHLSRDYLYLQIRVIDLLFVQPL